MHGVSSFFVLLSLLGCIAATPVNSCSGVKKNVDSKARVAPPPTFSWPRKPDSRVKSELQHLPTNKAPQHGPPTLSISRERYVSNNPGAPGKLKTNKKSQMHCAAYKLPSTFDIVAEYLGVSAELIEPNCSVSAPKSQVQPFNPGQRQPLMERKRLRKSSKRGLGWSSSKPEQAPPEYRNRVFLGYRGVNSEIAQSYRERGLENAPVNGHLSSMGDGLYLTDDPEVAHKFATMSANSANRFRLFSSNLARPSICTIFAIDDSYFRDSIHKVFLPPSAYADKITGLRRGSQASQAHQLQWIRNNVPALSAVPSSSIVKFSNIMWDCPLHPMSPNQMLIPGDLLQHFYVDSCVDYDACGPIPNLAWPTLEDRLFHLDYREKYSQWNIHGTHYDALP